MAVAIGAAFGWLIIMYFGKGRRRRNETGREINATLTTGLPSQETALGRKAREILAAQEEKLRFPPPVHGTARWGQEVDAAALCEEDPNPAGCRTIRLGGLINEDGDCGLDVRAKYPGHILTVAATGQGKSATQIVENLLTYTGSVVVLDPKGELYDLTHERRREFGNVYRLAPYAREGEYTDHYNPLDDLDHPRELGTRARFLAEMLIVRSPKAGDGRFFENEGINLLTAILMLVVDGSRQPELRHHRTMREVRRICTLPVLGAKEKRNPDIPEYLEDVFQTMALRESEPYLVGQGNTFLGVEHKLLSSFVSEINSNLAFFDGHPGFAEVTNDSDFSFADVCREPTTVYLTIPLKQTPMSFRFLRAMIGMAFAAMEEQREATEASVLFVLDEFAALKEMDFMRDAVAQMRSSGAWFWFFVQDISQLHSIYHAGANVFLSQTDHQVFFGAVSDTETRNYLAQTLGTGTFAYRDAQLSWGQSIGINDGKSAGMQAASISSGRNVGQSINLGDPVVLAPKQLLTPFEVGTVLGQRRPGETHPSPSIMLSKHANGFPLLLRRRHWKAVASGGEGRPVNTLAPLRAVN